MRLSAAQVIEKIHNASKEHEVIPSGLSKLDQHLDGGFFKKELVVVGAPTGTGKSQLASHFLLAAANAGFKTAYFSLEISDELVVSRLMAMSIDIKASRLLWGWLTPEEIEQRTKAEAAILALGDLINFYDDVYTLKDIVKEITTQQFEYIVIDFIQNVATQGEEYERLSQIAITLQRLAKKINACFIIISQLSNSAAKNTKSWNLEYKGSGSIAMVADLGFILEPVFVDSSNTIPGGTRLMLKKNRRGVSGVNFELGFRMPGGKIYEK